jgi:hypothetical protein
MPPEDVPVDADLRAMYAFMAGGGYTVDVASVHATYPEVPWRDVDTWARAQDWRRLLRGSAA